MDRSVGQQAGGVGHDMALEPFDLLGGIVTLQPTALSRLDRLAVDDPGRRAGLAAGGFAGLQRKLKINPPEKDAVAPFIEVHLHLS